MNQMPVQSDELTGLIESIKPIDIMGFSGEVPPDIAGSALSLLHWLARAREGAMAPIQHPRISLFAAHHGFSDKKARETAEKLLESLQDEAHPLPAAALSADADLRVYEMNLAVPTADNRSGPAMDLPGLTMAMAYGMMAVEPGVELIVPGGFGGGSDEAALALLQNPEDGLDALMRVGGFETAAAAGVIVAARLAGIPVLIDNAPALAALAALCALNPFIADHCACTYPAAREIKAWLRARKANLLFIPARTEDAVPGLDGALYLPLIQSLSALIAGTADARNAAA